MLQSIVEQRKNIGFIARRKKFPKYYVSEQVLLLHLQQAGSHICNILRQQRKPRERDRDR
jgi:hypothetical protein